MPYFVYVLKSSITGTSYIGSTSDIEKRLFEHNNNRSIYTRSKGPWKLVYCEEFKSRPDAMKREKYFKTQIGRLELKGKGIIR